MKKVAILGSTGSIGTQALEVISCLQENQIKVVSLAAGRNIDLLRFQIKKFNPKKVSLTQKEDAILLAQEFPNVKFLHGDEGLIKLATDNEIDTLLVAVSGKVGLKPTIEAIKQKKRIALANKETLVMAGDIVMNLAQEYDAEIIPVDSEHSAIFQCLKNKKEKPKRLIITASGGPFLNERIEKIKNATAADALKHPKWNMGKKITIDSSTLMNKGLEIIEAHHLFNMPYENIKVVIHPQSIVHSAIEHLDGSIIAQLGLPSMHIPIQYALLYPERIQGIETDSFDFAKIAQLTFEEPDYKKFPALQLAFEAGKQGCTYPCVLNAANEESVMAFLDNKIKLIHIVSIVEKLLNEHTPIKNASLDDIITLDEKIRTKTKELINKL